MPDSHEEAGETPAAEAVDDDTEAQPEAAPSQAATRDQPDADAAAAAPAASAIGLLRPNGAVILLGLLFALAVIESIAAFLEYREHISEDDWQEVSAVVAEHPGEPVIVASEWLGPSARMHLAQTRTWDSLAYPDLRSFGRFWLLMHKRERPWRGPLLAELEELPRPRLLGVHDIGDLTLLEYQHSVGVERFSLLESVARVSTARGRCSGRGQQWKCKDGRVSLRTVEIDYRPRRCALFELDDGVVATLDLGELELGDRIRGHVGFTDFNARLRADPSARVELWIDGALAGRWVFSDDQGWAAFALATAAGAHTLELRASTTVAGTWQRDGHQATPTDALCIELRGFDEGGATP